MNYLASPEFNAQKMCGSLCLQHKVNEALDDHLKGRREIKKPSGTKPTFVLHLKTCFLIN